MTAELSTSGDDFSVNGGKITDLAAGVDPTDAANVSQIVGGSGAPADADYLVGTANGGLSAEIVVGTTPGGELGGTWASPTVDATHSGSTHAAVQAAAEATAASALSAHTGDTSDAHDASAISFSPVGTIAATDVQAAIEEVAAEASGASFATPSIALAASAAGGAAATVIRSDSTIAAFDATSPVTQAFGDAAAVGSAAFAARRDHKHAMPSNADVETAYNAIIAAVSQADAEAGTGTSVKRWTPERVAQAIAALGFAPNVTMQVKTDTSGTYTPTTGMQKVLVFCVGGGGGAPAATGADEAVSGGGAGGAAIKLFSAAAIGASQAYAVGQTATGGGNASGLGAANALLQATGGAVGVASGNLTLAAVKGGLGGVGTLGDLNIRGGPGGHAAILSTAISHGGNGGNSIFGGGGRGGSTATTVEQGEAGQAYGGGAGGGKTSDGTDLSAVAGAAGVIYFIEFLKVGAGAATTVELDYVTQTTDLTVTATSAATAQAFLTGNAVTYDGSRVKLEWWSANVTGATGIAIAELYDGATDQSLRIGQGGGSAIGAPMYGVYFFTPAAGSHTFSIKFWRATANMTIAGSSAGVFAPAFLRITRA